ncbi:hypothetical protein N5D03_01780 [Empedobacter sp. GD03861]|uniref:hypothetical protein n=1 Tax=Empedobacter sp. GD03861 TaxID=2975390 RepID=UPI002449876D|nr:hypothetical protein [Empedobacter sp. GD03861]MDH0673273.1 hypothetical protein [Empedobacter sp. GD03861]
MKKIVLTLCLTFGLTKVFACADGGGEDYYYYNLFSQTLSEAPQYQPFLMTLDNPYYTMDANQKNENILDWQKTLGISYQQAFELVFKASKQEIDMMVKNGKSSNSNYNFATTDWVKKNKQSLLYLSYAKYLEPYMAFYYIDNGEWSYVDRPEKNVNNLNYKKVLEVLKKSWNAETDKELKIRYGYQLVRFAHYFHEYKDAINYFNMYVASQGLKNSMYYYALDQKGGAERALGNYIQANYDFFEVFSHSNDRKMSAYQSMRVTEDLNYEKMLANAKTIQEKNDLYLLIGYNDFSNPLAPAKKIIANDVNAPQARILFARSINLIEREYLQQNPEDYYWDSSQVRKKYTDLYLPVKANNDYYGSSDENSKDEIQINELISLAKSQATKANDKEYWNLSVAYLNLLNKNFAETKDYLAKVNSTSKEFQQQKKVIEILLEIFEQKKITDSFENQLMQKYASILNYEYPKLPEDVYGYSDEDDQKMNLKNVILDVLANRYFLQGDKGKAFLIHNEITQLGSNPDWTIINDLDKLDKKSNKTAFEKYLINAKVKSSSWDWRTEKSKEIQFKLSDYLADFKGTLYLGEMKFDLAKKEFEKIDQKYHTSESAYFVYDYDYTTEKESKTWVENQFDGYHNIPNKIFGYNKIECFNCDENQVIATPYLNEFKFIKPKMSKLELTNAMIELNKIAKKNTEEAAKANYLLVNFFYNTTTLGYYRYLLTFDRNNDNGPKFNNYGDQYEATSNFFYKSFGWGGNYVDNFTPSENYLKKAFDSTKDKEMKAQILFALSKNEQGRFYNAKDPVLKRLYENQYDNEDKILGFKVANYRSNFKNLKQYSDTKTYQEIKSNCKYFDYYTNNF